MTHEINSPLTLPCGAVLKNRICKAAMTEGLADAGNNATDKHAVLYEKWATGGSGLLLTGNVQIDHRCLERPGNVVIEGEQSAEQLAALRKWSAAGTQNGTHLWMQISHAGRQTPASVNKSPLAPSNIPVNRAGGLFGTPTPMTEDDILAVIDKCAHAAKIARETGFTGVQIHAAHGYLMSAFLSPDVNTRTDSWGGSLENRARLLLETVRATRQAVGKDFPISVKLNSADFQRGGFSDADALQVASWLNDEKIDLLEISGGTYEQPRMAGNDEAGADPARSETRKASTIAREAYFLEYAADMRGVTDMPLLVTGGFRTVQGMNDALAAGACDMVGVGRPLCGMPDAPNKLLSGELAAMPVYENNIRLGRGWLGDASPFKIIQGINGWGKQGWFCMQLINMASGQAPDLKMGVIKAITRYQKNEGTAATAYRAHYGLADE